MFLEERRYPPPEDFAAQANAQPDIYERDFEEFWETEGRERVTWFEPFTELLDWQPPVREVVPRRQAQRLLQLRRPARRGRERDKVAYHWEGEPEGDRRTITFSTSSARSCASRTR